MKPASMAPNAWSGKAIANNLRLSNVDLDTMATARTASNGNNDMASITEGDIFRSQIFGWS